jgi:clan AA aspartic protease (TIGR02281 family)
MRHKFVLIFILLSLIINIDARAQATTEEKLQDAIWLLRDFIRNWSCVPYVKGSITENLEVSLKDGKLLLKQNFSTTDVNILGFPEYTKTIIDLTMVNSIAAEDSDKGCAGIIIKTKKNGIQLINKYVNNISEVPHPKESNIREQFGWIDGHIRINKNESFQERANKVIQTLKLIALLSGNHLLEGQKVESNTESSTGNIIKMKSIGGVSVIPCKVNGLNLNFIFDTGASNVSLSMTEATFMLKNDYLSVSDIIGSNKFLDASGNISEGVVINLKEIEIGGVKLYNVRASVVKNNKAPLLLGQSAIKKLGEIKFDLEENTLTILSGVVTNGFSDINQQNQQPSNIHGVQSNHPVIGNPIKIGNLEITQYYFPNESNWNDAKEACANLGNGWRLPTKEELNYLYQNRGKIGVFAYFYHWSSTEANSTGAWLQSFYTGNQDFTNKDFNCYVRAVRSL